MRAIYQGNVYGVDNIAGGAIDRPKRYYFRDEDEYITAVKGKRNGFKITQLTVKTSWGRTYSSPGGNSRDQSFTVEVPRRDQAVVAFSGQHNNSFLSDLMLYYVDLGDFSETQIDEFEAK